jgi:hypothetical protein
MKLKLAALLFSQAAAQATQKTAPSYYCDEDVFKLNKISAPTIYPEYIKRLQVEEIDKNYRSYCDNLAQHEVNLATRAPGSDCTYKTKNDVKKSCESLKTAKAEMPDVWNERVASLTPDCAKVKPAF